MTKSFSLDNPLASVSEETRAFLARKHKLFIGGKWSTQRAATAVPVANQIHTYW